MKKLLIITGYIWFLFMLFIVGLFTDNLIINASTTENWATKEVKIYTCHDDTCNWSNNYTANHTFSGSDLTYPVHAIEWRVKATNGLSIENSYTFSFGYKPTPDSLHPRTYFMRRNAQSSKETITCQTSTDSNGYYMYKCTFTPNEDYASSEWLYIQIQFYDSYITNLNTKITAFEERQGTNSIITQQTNEIIQQNEQNTQNIINNNNENTQTIINNQNSNTQQQIESQKVCNNIIIDKKNIGIDNAYLTNTGVVITTGYGIENVLITPYIEIINATNLTVLNNSDYQSGACFYDNNKTIISCFRLNEYRNGETINIPNNSYYFRSTIYKNTNMPTYQIKICKNGNQALSESLTDDSVDNPSNSISEMENLLPTNGVITQLIALPITLYQKILNSINGTCSQYNLGSLYGTNLIIPCIDVSEYLGSSIWNTIDLIISGAFVLIMARKMIKAFENFTSMKEGDVIND